MTDITVGTTVVNRPARTRRAPLGIAANGVRAVFRSYAKHLEAEQFIVPDGRLAPARPAA